MSPENKTGESLAAQMQEKLEDLMDELRDHVEQADDPQAEALFETSAEVLGGLVKAFRHYRQGAEEAWEE